MADRGLGDDHRLVSSEVELGMRSEGLDPQPSDASMFVKDPRGDSSTG
jgi:hypothetical protein